MKNRTCTIILLMAMLIKMVSLCGCTVQNDKQISESQTDIEATTTMEIVSALQEEMTVFLKEHTEEMEKIARYLLNLENENEHFQYHVEDKLLYRYDEDYLTQEKIIDPILFLDMQFLDNTQLFNLIVPLKDHRIMGNDICEFSKGVKDDGGDPFCRVCLIYCNSTPIEKEYFEICSIIPNWYFYIEYFE